MDDSAFRPYHWGLTKAFLQDIFDGYFPYEFKDKYPDGVPLKAIDKTKEEYTKEKPMEVVERSNLPSNVKNMKSLNNPPKVTETKEEFLSKLPANIIRNGKVIPIRDEIGKMFGVILGKNELFTPLEK